MVLVTLGVCNALDRSDPSGFLGTFGPPLGPFGYPQAPSGPIGPSDPLAVASGVGVLAVFA